MFALLSLLACFEEPAPSAAVVASGPTLSFVEMPCDYEATADLDAPEYTMPAGAVVVGAMECSGDAGQEICISAAGWFYVERSGAIVGTCFDSGSTVVINYLE
jgi:hypothetical protein